MDGPDSLCSDDECWQPELRLQSFERYTFTKIRADPISNDH